MAYPNALGVRARGDFTEEDLTLEFFIAARPCWVHIKDLKKRGRGQDLSLAWHKIVWDQTT